MEALSLWAAVSLLEFCSYNLLSLITLFFLSRRQDTDNSPSWFHCHSFCSATEVYIYNAVRQDSACRACWLETDFKDSLKTSCFYFFFLIMALSRLYEETQNPKRFKYFAAKKLIRIAIPLYECLYLTFMDMVVFLWILTALTVLTKSRRLSFYLNRVWPDVIETGVGC